MKYSNSSIYINKKYVYGTGIGEDKSMLLAVDVGNTDITFGVFEGEKLSTRFRFTVKLPRTSDEYVSYFAIYLNKKDILLMI